MWSPWYEALWEPVFSPDGTQMLIRAVEDGTYFRQVVPFDSTFQGQPAVLTGFRNEGGEG